MPANYTVVEAEKVSDKPDRGYGPMQTIRMKLRNEQGNERAAIEWYAKATTPVPAAGQVLFGDVTQSDYGWQFKKTRTGPVSGSSGPARDYKADPVKQASIAMEASQKVALDALRFAHESGRNPNEVVESLKTAARALYEQISETSGAAK